jgi:Replication initiator protein, pSAM2
VADRPFHRYLQPGRPRVNDEGTPADRASYDYIRAARDAIHFAALFDRFIQNLRRVLGHEAQYFGGVEPQKRLSPHRLWPARRITGELSRVEGGAGWTTCRCIRHPG